jgi:DNA processing protein
MQITNFSFKDPAYPDTLRQLTDAPKSINVLGELPKPDDILVAIVGTRKSTPYGDQVTYQLANELAKTGAVIVSGLAIGIDGIAAQGALDAGGRTIAVLAHGLDRIYPTRHRPLAKQILRGGGTLISEYEAGVFPLRHHFVERNRIIAALSQTVIVTESPVKGGSLITAGRALELQRRVMAVPGNITSPTSVGPNNLIRTGQGMAITSSTDVISELGFLAREAVPVPAQSKDEAKIVELLKEGVSSSERLIEVGKFTAAQFANIISLMEITGKVRNLGAGQWVIR